MVVTEERKYLIVHKVVPRNTNRVTSQAENSKLLVKIFSPRVAKYLKNKKHNSLYIARKYARVFVLGHYLFLEAHSFLIIK